MFELAIQRKQFINENKEREFWTENDSTEFVDWEADWEAALESEKMNWSCIEEVCKQKRWDDKRSNGRECLHNFQSGYRLRMSCILKHYFQLLHIYS